MAGKAKWQRRPSLVLAAAAMALAALLAGCQQTAYTDLGQRQVNTMLAILLDHGIDARKQALDKGRYALTVDDGQLARAIDLLHERGYPHQQFASMADIFKQDGLLSSPLEERARYIYALSQSVAETLSNIDGVITVRVNLVVPKNNPFAEGIKPSSAAVFIKYRSDYDLQAIKSDIKLIVEKSIEGLAYDKITVVMLPAHDFAAGSRHRTPATAPAPWWVGALGIACLVSVGTLAGLRWRRRRPGGRDRSGGESQSLMRRGGLGAETTP